MTKTCRKCNGTGFLPHFAHVDFGRCWNCGPVVEPTPEARAYDVFWKRANAAKAFFGRRTFNELFAPYVQELRELEAAMGIQN